MNFLHHGDQVLRPWAKGTCKAQPRGQQVKVGRQEGLPLDHGGTESRVHSAKGSQASLPCSLIHLLIHSQNILRNCAEQDKCSLGL